MRPEPELLEAARQGERKAQYQLYRLCYPVLMGVCSRYRGNEQDAVAALNQAYLKIIQNLHRFPAEASFEAWIRRIQINVLIDEFRRSKQWRSNVSMPEELERVAASSSSHADWNHGAQQMEAGYIERLLQRLPPTTRQVFNLFALDGFSHAEISEMLGISNGTSKWHVNSARTQLKAWLAAYE